MHFFISLFNQNDVFGRIFFYLRYRDDEGNLISHFPLINLSIRQKTFDWSSTEINYKQLKIRLILNDFVVLTQDESSTRVTVHLSETPLYLPFTDDLPIRSTIE